MGAANKEHILSSSCRDGRSNVSFNFCGNSQRDIAAGPTYVVYSVVYRVMCHESHTIVQQPSKLRSSNFAFLIVFSNVSPSSLATWSLRGEAVLGRPQPAPRHFDTPAAHPDAPSAAPRTSPESTVPTVAHSARRGQRRTNDGRGIESRFDHRNRYIHTTSCQAPHLPGARQGKPA